VEKFESRFGGGSFGAIYDQYSIYDKYGLAGRYISRPELDRIMFGGEPVLDTGLAEGFAESIWRSRINEDNAVLPAGLI
jgi:hypothetical protein